MPIASTAPFSPFRMRFTSVRYAASSIGSAPASAEGTGVAVGTPAWARGWRPRCSLKGGEAVGEVVDVDLVADKEALGDVEPLGDPFEGEVALG